MPVDYAVMVLERDSEGVLWEIHKGGNPFSGTYRSTKFFQSDVECWFERYVRDPGARVRFVFADERRN